MSVYDKGQELGKAAFEAGKTCIPCHDENVTAVIKAEDVWTLGADRAKEVCDFLSGWLRGWHTANVAAPVV